MKTKSITFLLVLTLLLFGTMLIAQTATLPSGSGTEESPYEIGTLNNLYWITQNSAEWDKYYKQTADIDASSTSGWDGGNGFKPIGNSSKRFTGSYDGNGFEIDGLTIDRATQYQGMFGLIDGPALLDKIVLTSISIVAANYVGGLVGYQEDASTIKNCSTAGSVSAGKGVGGIVGKIGGDDGTSVVEYCHSSASVSATSYYLGGLVGWSKVAGVIIRYCYSTGDVTPLDAAGHYYDGGLVGLFTGGTIKNCYSSSSVFGNGPYAAGLVGKLTAGTVENCYSVGHIYTTSNSHVGGLIGRSGGTVTNCFWDIETSGKTSSDGGFGKTTAEMKTESTFTGWDFTTVWQIIGTNYPDLNGNVVTVEGYRNIVTVDNSFNKLGQNYPNPFNPSTQISFSIAKAQNVNISVYNTLGEKVAELVNTKMNAGTHSVNFNGSNLASGLYFYKLATPNYTKTMKMLLIK